MDCGNLGKFTKNAHKSVVIDTHLDRAFVVFSHGPKFLQNLLSVHWKKKNTRKVTILDKSLFWGEQTTTFCVLENKLLEEGKKSVKAVFLIPTKIAFQIICFQAILHKREKVAKAEKREQQFQQADHTRLVLSTWVH